MADQQPISEILPFPNEKEFRIEELKFTITSDLHRLGELMGTHETRKFLENHYPFLLF